MKRPFRRIAPLCGPAALLLLTGGSALPVSAQFQSARVRNPFVAPAAIVHQPRVRDYHVSHLKLVLAIDAATHSATGVVTHTLAPLRESLPAIILDAGDNLKIEGCRLNGAEVKFTHEKGALTITPDTPLALGKEVLLEIRYTLPPKGSGRFGGPNGGEGLQWVDPRPDSPDRRPGFWTQGETQGNRHWVPCYDAPNDKCTSETIVTVPEEWQVIGNGVEGETTHDTAKRTRTFRWTMNQPHSTYLLSLVGGELDVQKDSWAGIPLYYVVPKGKADLISGSFGNTPDMLQFFSDKLGFKYPWPKYAQSAVFDFGGGMENVSATTLGVFGLTDRRSGNYPMSSLNSHELAHQWFGDLVTCSDWGDIWLNESFATFFQMLYTEHLEGKDKYDIDRDNNLHQYLFEARRYKRPLSTNLYASPDVMFDAHTYPKGGVILHMLRRELGDDAFFRGLRHYLQKYGYQPVSTDDLQKAMQEATRRNLAPFFDQWVRKPGHPVLEMTWSADATGKSVVVKVKQTQDTKNGTPIYTLPLQIALLTDPSGSALTADKKSGAERRVERKRFVLNRAEQEFRISTATRPAVVLIDPDHDLLMETNTKWTDSELPIVFRYAPCVLDRMAALMNLVPISKTPTESDISLLSAALRAESSEDCGERILRRLGGAKQESLRALFREEAHSKQLARRAAALEALGSLPRNAEDVALLREVGMSDTEPYRVVEAALTALSQLNPTMNMDVFAHQVAAKSLRDRLAARVVDTLATAKLDVAEPVLIEATQPGRTARVRARAAKALGDIAPTSEAIHNALLSLLKEEDTPTAQSAAIDALKARKDKDAVAALRELAKSAKSSEVRSAAQSAADTLEKPSA